MLKDFFFILNNYYINSYFEIYVENQLLFSILNVKTYKLEHNIIIWILKQKILIFSKCTHN